MKSLKHGRPPLAKPPSTTLSSKRTRNVIRGHHNLLKAHARALQDGDTDLAEQLSQQLSSNSLKTYQLASKTGQSATRGGDSSKLLLEWLQPLLNARQKKASTEEALRVLEIGSLSTQNAISNISADIVKMTRIDLHAQEKGILQQDFMARPLPSANTDKFHIISCSLVLNFVGDAKGRGEMLKRCTQFLLPSSPAPIRSSRDDTHTANEVTEQQDEKHSLLPSLFLVLPAPCITNSRYLTSTHMQSLMSSLGFTLLKSKTTAKLWYSLWNFSPSASSSSRGQHPQQQQQQQQQHHHHHQVFKKKELVRGKTRNNFAVVLE